MAAHQRNCDPLSRHMKWLAPTLVLPVLLVLFSACSTGSRRWEPVYFPKPPAQPRVVFLRSFNQLADLVAPNVSFMDVIRGESPSPFVSTPAGIAYARGHLYICDTDLDVVHDWDLTTGSVRRFGSGKDALGKPVAVAVDEESRVYIADTERAEVVAFSSAGEFLRRYRPPDVSSYRPVAVAMRDARLFVADIERHVIDVFSTATGQHIAAVGGVGSGPGEFYFPMGVATGSNGQLFVSDMMNGRVQVLDEDYEFIRVISQPGDRYGDMGKPRHLAIAADGTIAVADSEFAHVHLFDRDGRLLLPIGGPSDSPSGTPMPVGVAIAPSLPESIMWRVPPEFDAQYFLFVTSSVGTNRISLFAVGAMKP